MNEEILEKARQLRAAGASIQEVEQYLQSKLGQAPAPEVEEPTPGIGTKALGAIASLGRDIPGVEALQAAARSGTSGPMRSGPMGVVDVISNAVANGRQGYQTALKEIRQAEDTAPMAATLPARVIGGGLASAVLPGGAALKGAQYGALSGALSSDPNSDVQSRAIGATAGAGIGALAGHYGGKLADKVVGKIPRLSPKAVPLEAFPKMNAASGKVDGFLGNGTGNLAEVAVGPVTAARAPGARIPIRVPQGSPVVGEIAPQTEGFMGNSMDNVLDAVKAQQTKEPLLSPGMTLDEQLQTLLGKSREGLPRGETMGSQWTDPPASALETTVKQWKPRSAPQARFDWYAERMKKAQP